MNKKKQEIDIIDKILDACYQANPDALFILSLMHQYEERGSMSKKQLQGLYEKAKKVRDMPANWLATLEARILKMPTRYKSGTVSTIPAEEKDEESGQLISSLLVKYPQHKRVLYLQSKYQNNEPLSAAEKNELVKFKRLLL